MRLLFLSVLRADNKIAALEERIKRALSGGPLAKRDLERKINKARCGIWMWNNAIKNLTRAGEVRWNKQKEAYELG